MPSKASVEVSFDPSTRLLLRRLVRALERNNELHETPGFEPVQVPKEDDDDYTEKAPLFLG